LRIPCPPEGLGVNTWTWYAAKSLFDRGVAKNQALAMIASISTRSDTCRRDKEIKRAVERAWDGVESQHQGDLEYYKDPDLDLIRAVDRLDAFLYDTVQLDSVSGGRALNVALDRDAIYAVGTGVDTLEYWTPSEGPVDSAWQFICPNPLHTDQIGRVRDNIKATQYAVVEFDDSSLPWQLAAHTLLGMYSPLVLLVYSGNKSYHGWYLTPLSHEFKHLALLLGADKTVINRPEQWVRIPGGKNGTTRKSQEAWLFN
jgi:hypothetical protein